MKKLTVALAMTFLMLVIVCINEVFAEPPLKDGNPGLPGCFAQVDQLEQVIADQKLTILGLQEQINALEALLDALENYIPAAKCPQTESFADSHDGDLQKGMDWPKTKTQ